MHITLFTTIIILLIPSLAPATDVIYDDITPQIKEHSWRILERLNWFQNEEKLCDVTIIVGDRSFRAHKLVLSAGSPYFEAMFANRNMRESVSTEPITLHNLDAEAFEMMKNYIYTGRIDIDDSNIVAVLAAADRMEMTDIKNDCCAYIKREVNAENCIGTKYIADKYSCSELLNYATEFTLDAFKEVVEYPEFLGLTEGQLINIISDDELSTSEDKIYEAVMRWIRYQGDSVGDRTVHLPTLMQHVRFSQMPPNYLVEVSEDPLIKSCKQCLEYVKESEDYLSMCDLSVKRADNKSSLNARFKPRKNDYLFAVGGFMRFFADPTSSVERYDLRKDKWTIVASMNTPRWGLSVAVLNKILFAVGGCDGSTYLKSVECYNPHTEKWTDNVKPLERGPASANSVNTLNGIFYVMHGRGSELKSVVKYDPNTNEWIEYKPPRQNKSGYAVGVLDGYIYILGGFSNGQQFLNTVERYDPKQNEWHDVPPMITKRSDLASVVHKCYLYAVGGIGENSETLKSAERYDPREKKWEEIVPMSKHRYDLGLAVANGLIYAVGGRDLNCNLLNTVEVFDPTRNEWSEGVPMLHARSNFGLVAMRF